MGSPVGKINLKNCFQLNTLQHHDKHNSIHKVKREFELGLYDHDKRSIQIPNKPEKFNFTNLRNEIELKRICQSDCEVLENELCRVEYLIAKKHPLIGQRIPLEDCANLPKLNSETSMNCLLLGIDRSQDVQLDDTCYWGTGQDYRGDIAIGVSGRSCIKWAHQFYYQITIYPELAGGHANCRNPGGTETEPWCYVEQTEKEFCDVPKCSKYRY